MQLNKDNDKSLHIQELLVCIADVFQLMTVSCYLIAHPGTPAPMARVLALLAMNTADSWADLLKAEGGEA